MHVVVQHWRYAEHGSANLIHLGALSGIKNILDEQRMDAEMLGQILYLFLLEPIHIEPGNMAGLGKSNACFFIGHGMLTKVRGIVVEDRVDRPRRTRFGSGLPAGVQHGAGFASAAGGEQAVCNEAFGSSVKLAR